MKSLEMYYRHRPEIQSADLLQWQSKSLLGKMIRIFSPGANHSSSTLCMSYHGLEDRRWTTEALEHGLEINLLSDRLEAHNGCVWWHPLKPEHDPCRKRIAALSVLRATTRSNRGYDYDSLFKNIFGRVSADARRYFCSEFVYLNGRDCGLPLPDEWPWEQAPRPGDMPKLEWWGNPVLIYDSDSP